MSIGAQRPTAVIKNNTLYIDGGSETFIDGDDKIGNITFGYNNYLITVDLSNSWDWRNNISEKALPKRANSPTNMQIPILARGALYHGADADDCIYLWGGTTNLWNTSFPGFQAPSSQQYSLWSFNIVNQQWNQYDTTLGSAHRPSRGSFTEARDQGLGFFFNGQLDSGSELETEVFGDKRPQFLEGMIVIDTNNKTARNLSTKAVSGDLPRSRGRMQYVDDIGTKGVLVQIGGNQQSVTVQKDSFTGNLVPMNVIDVFDVASYYSSSTPDGVWYRQSTSGETPDGRIDFCVIQASATDGSSHNLYVYGGRGPDDVFFDDVWVLSLPGFVWTKIYQGNSPRAGHTCHRVGSRTMITVGGTANTDYGSPPCDWETKGVGVFEISDVTWGSKYNATQSKYTVPSQVVAQIGGNQRGGATMRQPVNGFSQTELAKLFNVKVSTPATPPTPDRPRPKHTIAPLIGGLIGGIAFLIFAAAAIFYYKRTIQHFWSRVPDPRQEMDDNQRIVKEMMDKDVFWELPADDKPVEIGPSASRADGDILLVSEMHLKHINDFF
ncbi:hypothetical protein ACLMJK_006894 [Lecanora helva]